MASMTQRGGGGTDRCWVDIRPYDAFLVQVRQSHGMEEAWSDIVIRIGAYVGEVIRRNSIHRVVLDRLGVRKNS